MMVIVKDTESMFISPEKNIGATGIETYVTGTESYNSMNELTTKAIGLRVEGMEKAA